MLIVLALGGNALLQPHETLAAENLIKNSRDAVEQLAKIANLHQLVIVHGNGPQIGLLALQAEAYQDVPSYPFDILNAESQGMIGYILQQALKNELPKRNITTLLTQVLVNPNDNAFLFPSKPIGPFYTKTQYQQITIQHPYWQFQKNQQGFRRIIASPKPQFIIELNTIQDLLQHNHIVISGGGGGIPCILKKGKIEGIEAVIDKDLTASLLACALHADRLIILTNVDAVYKNWGSSKPEALGTVALNQLQELSFESGSMQPKVEAACNFVVKTYHKASIGHLNNLEDIMQGKIGTHIVDLAPIL